MVVFMICIIFSPAWLLNIHFFSFKFVPIMSLGFFLFYFISNLIFCSSLTPFYLLASFSYFCFKIYFSLATTYFYSILLLFLFPLASPYYISCHYSFRILFHILKMPLFSFHLYQSFWLLIWWLLLHFYNFISRSSLFLYSKSQILPFPSLIPPYLPPALSFFFNLNFSLFYPGFNSSFLVFLLPLSSQNHFSFL